MHLFLADGYIPLAPIAPASQAVLLIAIIFFEAFFIGKQVEPTRRKELWWKSAVGNLLTAGLGVLLAIPASMLEAWIVLGQHAQWSFGYLLYGFVLPWSIWLICYHLSWRTEALVLKRWFSHNQPDDALSKAVRNVHRWSYGFLGIIVLAGCLYYASILFS